MSGSPVDRRGSLLELALIPTSRSVLLRARLWTGLALLAIVPQFSCVGDPEIQLESPGPVRQSTTYKRTRTARPSLMVLVVDDSPSDVARAFRAQIAGDLDGWIDRRRADDCVAADDPSDFLPADLRVLSRPRTPGGL